MSNDYFYYHVVNEYPPSSTTPTAVPPSRTAKYEEAECNMPMISELADATEMSLTTPIVTRGELDLVQK